MKTAKLRLISALATAAFLLAAAPTHATVTARDVRIKGPGSGATVYYLASDGKRYVFPNQKTYLTWYADFTGVLTVDYADLITFPLGGNVTYRPGVRLVKITTDPKVYAVDHGGRLRWVKTEAVAKALYGTDWNKKVDDVPDAFFTNYLIGADIVATSDFSPATATANATSVNVDRGIASSQTPSTPTPPAVVPPPATTCTADVWVCTTWSACDSSGTQTRTCSLSTDCPGASSATPAQSQSCTPTVSTGTISVSDSTDAGSVAGGTDAVLAKFRLTASYEDLRLTKASFNVASPSAVSSLSLYDGVTQVSTTAGVDAGGNAFFSNVNFFIPKNTSKDLIVKGHLNPVGPSGIASGANARVTLKDTGGAYVFEMIGASAGSNTHITAIPGGEQMGRDKIVRRAVPIVAVASLPTTVLTAGNVVAARVTVTASGGDLALKTLTVDVNKPTNASVDSSGDASHSAVRVYGNGENIAGHSTASSGCAAGAGTSCQVRTKFDVEDVIAAGSTKTYDVRLTVGGTLVKGDSIATSLEGDTHLETGKIDFGSNGDQVKVASVNVNVAWSDLSAVPHSATVGSSSADWASGLYVNILPTDQQVLVK
jgi:hypothetical protein